jgi:hypothetical protein
MMSGMEQGDATVWAAGLGIIGTLTGALGGAWLQGLSARRQLKGQQAAQVKHWLREERQAAFAAVLNRCDQVVEALGPIITARVQPDWEEHDSHRELWAPANAALRALQRSATTVAITGPDRMVELASAIHDAVLAQANWMRVPELEFDERTKAFAQAGVALEDACRSFAQEARAVLAASPR